jgi:uncharacterized protein (TIGR02996 family)
MDDHRSWLRVIAESPDGDEPRLGYAQWLKARSHPRGALIEVQCALARLPPAAAGREPLERREAALLRRCHRWGEGRVERGVIPLARIDLTPFLRDGHALAEQAIEHAVLGFNVDVGGGSAQALFASPHLDLVRGLIVHRREDLRVIIERDPPLPALRALSYWAGFDQAPLDAALLERLVEARLFDRVSILSICRGGIDAALLERFLLSPRLRALRELDLGDNRLGPTGALLLAAPHRLPDLVALDLGGNALGNAGAAAIALAVGRPRLQCLGIGRNGIGPEGVEAIASSPALAPLEELRLDLNPIGAPGAAALARSTTLRRLRRLDLTSAVRSAVDQQDFVEAWRWPDLREVHFGWSDRGRRGDRAGDGPEYFCRSRPYPSLRHPLAPLAHEAPRVTAVRVEVLGYVWQPVGPDWSMSAGAERVGIRKGWVGALVVRAMPRLVNLRTLVFGERWAPIDLDDDEARALALALPRCEIAVLDLSHCRMTREALRVIVGALALRLPRRADLDADVIRAAASARLEQLEELDLGGSAIGDDGVRALLASPRVQRLVKLGLRGSGVTDEGALAIARAIDGGSLRDVDLRDNPITRSALASLVELFRRADVRRVGLKNHGELFFLRSRPLQRTDEQAARLAEVIRSVRRERPFKVY